VGCRGLCSGSGFWRRAQSAIAALNGSFRSRANPPDGLAHPSRNQPPYPTSQPFLRSAQAAIALRSGEESGGNRAELWPQSEKSGAFGGGAPRFCGGFFPDCALAKPSRPVTDVTGSSRLLRYLVRGRTSLEAKRHTRRDHGPRTHHRRAGSNGVACRNRHAHIDRGVHRGRPSLSVVTANVCGRRSRGFRDRLAEPGEPLNDYSSRTGG
jgi:hypothetical protein